MCIEKSELFASCDIDLYPMTYIFNTQRCILFL